MKKSRFAIAAAAIAGALLLAPTAAFATGEPGYTPTDDAKTVNIGQGGQLCFTNFPANTPVTAESPSDVTLAVLRAATLGKMTDASGTVCFTASSARSGVFEIVVTADEFPDLFAIGTLTVLPADGNLTGTGSSLPTLAIWGAGAALALGAAGIATVAIRRRRTTDR